MCWQCLTTKSLLPFCVVQILRVLGESAIAVRTKAMKCLSEVVAVDPSILARVSVASVKAKCLWKNITLFIG